jgi:hypothetical protein
MMAGKKKEKKCPFLNERISGKWLVEICTIKVGLRCPKPATCRHSDQYVEYPEESGGT